jgi:neutral ceramidase
MVNVGSAKADITPPVGLSLSGFAARQDLPATGIDDPLSVRALVLSSETEAILCLSFELLGLDLLLDHQIKEKLLAIYGDTFSESAILITTTHTHSAPPTMPIAGETRVPDSYIQKIIDATLSATGQALNNRQEASLYYASTNLAGINHNRRQSQFPQVPAERFPFDNSFDLFVYKTHTGNCLAALVRFSCHAVTKCKMTVSADYPGELTRRLEAILGTTVIFLQGTAGDTNPTVSDQDHAGMQLFVDRIMAQISQMPANLERLPDSPLRLNTGQISLAFAPFPDREEIVNRIARNNRILAGDMLSPDLQPQIKEYTGWRLPDNQDIRGTVLHFAEVFNQAAEVTLAAIDDQGHYQGVPFLIKALRLGPFTLLFLSGEVLTTIGRQISQMVPRLNIKVISYLSPIIGYIGKQEDYRIGGYEPDGSCMWYRLPGPFREDIEKDIMEQVKLIFSDEGQS